MRTNPVQEPKPEKSQSIKSLSAFAITLAVVGCGGGGSSDTASSSGSTLSNKPLPIELSIQIDRISSGNTVTLQTGISDISAFAATWDYGDGSTGTSSTYTYKSAGFYTPVLKLRNQAGDTREYKGDIIVGGIFAAANMSCSEPAYKGWCQVSPRFKKIEGYAMVDERVGWRYGEQGLIERTEDGGKSWTTLYPRVSFDIVQVSALDSNLAIAAYKDGAQILTEDSGKTWRPIAAEWGSTLKHLNALGLSSTPLSLKFHDASKIFNEDLGIYSVDRGKTFRKIEWENYNILHQNSLVPGIFYRRGAPVVGTPSILLLFNPFDGAWRSVFQGSAIEPIVELNFFTKEDWRIKSDGKYYYTKDSGSNWIQSNINQSAISVNPQTNEVLAGAIDGGLQIYSEQGAAPRPVKGLAVMPNFPYWSSIVSNGATVAFMGLNPGTNRPAIFYSTDYGSTWSSVDNTLATASSHCRLDQVTPVIYTCTNSSNGIGHIFDSRKGSNGWSSLSGQSYETAVERSKTPQGLIIMLSASSHIQRDATGSGDTWFRSNDGGMSWRQFTTRDDSGNSVFLRRIRVSKSGVLFASMGSEYDLYTSRDGGSTWKIATKTAVDMADFDFQDENRGWITLVEGYSRSGNGMVTNDGGSTWSYVKTPARTSQIVFTKAGMMSFVDGEGLLKSDANGETWSSVLSAQTIGESRGRVTVTSTGRLWLVTETGKIWGSADDGKTWVRLAQTTISRQAFAADGDTLWLLGTESDQQVTLFTSRDGGSTWSGRSAPLSAELRYLGFDVLALNAVTKLYFTSASN
jgi:photosystem II stability/assembly factor-like uncharacterized protein